MPLVPLVFFSCASCAPFPICCAMEGSSGAHLEERLEILTTVVVHVGNGNRGNLGMGAEGLLRGMDKNDRLS